MKALCNISDSISKACGRRPHLFFYLYYICDSSCINHSRQVGTSFIYWIIYSTSTHSSTYFYFFLIIWLIIVYTFSLNRNDKYFIYPKLISDFFSTICISLTTIHYHHVDNLMYTKKCCVMWLSLKSWKWMWHGIISAMSPMRSI